MNIGIVTENYGVIYDGYMVYVGNLFKNLSKRGHNVYIFAPEYPQINPNSDPHIIWIPSIYSQILPPYRLSKPWAAKKVFEQRFRELRLDIVHSQIPSLLIYPTHDVAKKIGIPHIATYHTYIERYVTHYVPLAPQSLARWIARTYSHSTSGQTDCVIVPSVSIGELLQGYGIKTKTEFISHGIDIETFKNANGLEVRRKLGIEESDKVLLYVGRLSSEKNIEFLFEVLSRLRKDTAVGRIKMLVVGTGRHEAEIKQKCREMGLDDAVIFAGLVTDRKLLADFYAAGDVFTFASVTEVFGLVLLEAQACGTPVVAVGRNGACSAVEEGNGGFLTRLDLEQFTETVRKLLLDPELRKEQSRRAREHANIFSMDAMTDNLLKVYETLIRDRQKL
jgi:1,2-diacylglycerol 3-alpha-glucosyltransferase